MKYRNSLYIAILLIGGLLLSSCTGAVGSASWPGMSVDGDTLYLSYSNSIFAMRVTDGNLIWRFPTDKKNTIQFFAPAYPAEDQLIVGDYANLLYSIDTQNGSQNWTFSEAKGRWIGSALVTADDLILAPSSNSNLYALTAAGQKQWVFEESTEALWAQPVIDGNIVYQVSMDHNLYAINSDTGEQLWIMELDGAMVYAPLMVDGTLYIATMADTLYAINVADQQTLWTFKSADEVWGIPVIQDDVLYFADLSGQIYAVNTDGSLAWQLDAGGPVAGSGALTPDGVVFVTETGEVQLVTYDGVKQWTRSIEGKLYGQPAIGEDRIVVSVVGGENLLVAYDFRGNETWTFLPPK